MDFDELMKLANKTNKESHKEQSIKEKNNIKPNINLVKSLIKTKSSLVDLEEKRIELLKKVEKDVSNATRYKNVSVELNKSNNYVMSSSNNSIRNQSNLKDSFNKNSLKNMSASEKLEHRLALQEKARKIISQPLSNKKGIKIDVNTNKQQKTKDEVSSNVSPKKNLPSASSLGIKPISQKMEEILSAKNNFNYKERTLPVNNNNIKKNIKIFDKNKKSKKDVILPLKEVGAPIIKKPKIVRHSHRQGHIKPMSFDEMMQQANKNKDCQPDWKEIDEKNKIKQIELLKQKDKELAARLESLSSPRKKKTVSIKTTKPIIKSTIKPAVPHANQHPLPVASQPNKSVLSIPDNKNHKRNENIYVKKTSQRKEFPVPVPDIPTYYDDEDYDSEMDDFIDDGDCNDITVSNAIRDIFGYDRRKYKNEDLNDIDNMEASTKQILAEERRSTKFGKLEDLEDIKKEEEEKRRKKERLKKNRKLDKN